MKRDDAVPRGSAILWVLMVAAIVALLAASAAPYLKLTAERTRVTAAAARLEELKTALNNFYLEESQKYPGRLSLLTSWVTLTSPNSCWQTNKFVNADTAGWVPFEGTYLPTAGLWTAIGVIQDSIPFRSPTGAGNPKDSLWITMNSVDIQDARLLKAYIDNSLDSTRDTVRYSAPVNGFTTVKFRVTPAALGKC